MAKTPLEQLHAHIAAELATSNRRLEDRCREAYLNTAPEHRHRLMLCYPVIDVAGRRASGFDAVSICCQLDPVQAELNTEAADRVIAAP